MSNYITKNTKALTQRYPHALLEEIKIKLPTYLNRYTKKQYTMTDFFIEALKEKLLRDSKQT